jgi:DNA-binding transcriptional regulator YbjK
MRKTLVLLTAFAVAVVIFGCQKKAEEPTAETAAAAMTVDEAKGRLKVILEDVENLRTTAEEPTAEMVQGFKDNVAKLEALDAELKEITAPEAEAAAYAEAKANVETAIEGVNGLVKLTEIAMNKDTKMAKEEVAAINDNARAKFVEACEYAAPEIAAKLKPPAEEPPK